MERKGRDVFGIRVERHGGPDVLEWGAVEDPTPGPHDLVVDLAFAGLNFLDCYQRTGLYPMELPFVPGSEGAGVVRDVGAEVSPFAAGDQVAWSSVLGSYAEQVRVPEASAVAVPDGVGLDVAAAVMLQGMTAHYLAFDSFPLAGEHRCLIHAGAGGTGQLLIQIAKRCGAEVFTTVGSDEEGGTGARGGRRPRDPLRRGGLRRRGRAHRRCPPARRRLRRGGSSRVLTEPGAAAAPRHDGHVRERFRRRRAVVTAAS